MLSKYEKAGRWICLLYRTGLYRKELEDLGLIDLLERCTKGEILGEDYFSGI